MGISPKLKQDLKNPWLRGILAIVAVTVTVNVAFIIYSFRSPPNLVVDNYYEQGKEYFHEERERAQAAAWRLELLTPDEARVGESQTYRLYVMDATGAPVKDGQVTLMAYRPSNASHDFKRLLSYADAGTFSGEASFPLPGNWDLIATVESGGEHFDVARRIFVHE
jgi:nitrogen fixation protein FixH